MLAMAGSEFIAGVAIISMQGAFPITQLQQKYIYINVALATFPYVLANGPTHADKACVGVLRFRIEVK
jgi:hypothetical protein